MKCNTNGQDGGNSKLAAQNRLIVLTSSSTNRLLGFRTKLQKQQKVDYIDYGFMQSKLSMEEYLSFYGIANGVYSAKFKNKMEAYIKKYGLSDYYEVPIRNLALREQLLIRFFITEQKAVKTVMIDNINGGILDDDLIGVIRSMQDAARMIECNCIIMTVGTPIIGRNEGEMYRL